MLLADVMGAAQHVAVEAGSVQIPRQCSGTPVWHMKSCCDCHFICCISPMGAEMDVVVELDLELYSYMYEFVSRAPLQPGGSKQTG